MANQNLKIQITAIDKTQRAFRAVGKGLAGVSRAVFSFKSAIAGAVGVAGLGLLVKSSLDSIDALGKTANKLGVTTQALQKLRFASELAGVETRTVDMAVQRFTRRLSEAAVGTGEAKDALKELGIDAAALTKLPLEDQMIELAGAFEEVESSGDKVRLAFKLFDSEGVAFVNTLKGGKTALQEMFAEVDDLGIALSTATVQGVERANDAFVRLTSLFKGVRDSVVGALAPAFETLADSIRTNVLESIKEAGGVEQFGRTLALTIISIFKNAARAIEGFVTGTVQQLNRVIGFAIEAGEALNIEWTKSLKEIPEVSLGLVGVFENLEGRILASAAATEPLKKGMKEAKNAAKEVAETFDVVAIKMQEVKKNGVMALEDSLVELGMQTKSVKEAFSDMARSVIADLMRMQIRQAITMPLAGAMGLTVEPEPKANGGPVTAGRPYLVGERGPELMVPNRSGSIVPNGAMGGGVTVNQTVQITTGVQQTVRAEVMNMLPDIANATKGAVLDARRRGGSFAAAFG